MESLGGGMEAEEQEVLGVLLMGELFADTLTKTEANPTGEPTGEPPFWLMCQQKRTHSQT